MEKIKTITKVSSYGISFIEDPSSPIRYPCKFQIINLYRGLAKDLLSRGNYQESASMSKLESRNITIKSSVIGLNMQRLDLSILDLHGIAFTSRSPKNSRTIKSQIQGLGEFGSRVSQEADL